MQQIQSELSRQVDATRAAADDDLAVLTAAWVEVLCQTVGVVPTVDQAQDITNEAIAAAMEAMDLGAMYDLARMVLATDPQDN